MAFAQMDPVVGAFEPNIRKIKEAYDRACSKQARLLLTPELSVCGYPPHDLLERPEMFERNEKALKDLVAFTRRQSCALVVGHVSRNPAQVGRTAQNVISIFENGKQVFRQAKTLLPTYDVFDEARYFEPASRIQCWECDGKRMAFAVCEDLWGHSTMPGNRKLYVQDPIENYRELKADVVFALSASPYEYGKKARREALHREIAEDLRVPIFYVNQVGATDEVLFDGNSFVMDSQGKLVGRLPAFGVSFGVVDWGRGTLSFSDPAAAAREDDELQEMELLHRALVTGIQNYFQRTGFRTAVVGLSGGIDSAVVATLASQALGPKNVLGVAMPSQYSSSHSLEDAETLARNLSIQFEVRPIKFLFSAFSRELAQHRGELTPVTLENLQSRLRGMTLMALSNHYSALVLTTGNKSELAMGYCTLYGDMVGALNPIGDLFKTRVYDLARLINSRNGNPIPERCLTKAPSAELRPNQKDQDTLPPYEILDPLLEGYIENALPVTDLEERFSNLQTRGEGFWVREVLRRLEVNEYKRRQAAPVLKISRKAFGIGRRIPIAKTWDQ